MAGIALTYDFADSAVQGFLDRLGDKAANAMQEALESIGTHFVNRVQENLRAGVQPDGKKIEPSRRALAQGGVTLLDKGHLRDSYTYNVDGAGTQVEIGSNLVYAAIHHFGGTAGRKHSVKLPARPVLGIGAADEEEISDIIQRHVQRALRNAAR